MNKSRFRTAEAVNHGGKQASSEAGNLVDLKSVRDPVSGWHSSIKYQRHFTLRLVTHGHMMLKFGSTRPHLGKGREVCPRQLLSIQLITSLQVLPWILLFAQQAAASGCDCTAATDGADKQGAMKLKLVAIASILTAGAAGVLVPVLGRSLAALRPDGDIFFAVKAFAAGVILATGMVHILPAAFDGLTSPCLHKGGGGRNGFPFAGLVAMSGQAGEEEGRTEHVHHATHGHSHGEAVVVSSPEEASIADTIRHRVVSQVRAALRLKALAIRGGLITPFPAS